MKKKLLCAVISAVMILSGCSKQQPQNDVIEDSPSLLDEYTDLTDENNLYYGDKQALHAYIEHGTGILFLGFPECPWCQAYLPLVDSVLKETSAVAAYYNIYTDKIQDREFYDEIASLLISQNDTDEDIIQYDNDGQYVIYMPLLLFIEEGRIIAFDHETSMEDSSLVTPQEYWTQEKVEQFQERIRPWVVEIKTVQEEKNAQGCDTGCKVTSDD